MSRTLALKRRVGTFDQRAHELGLGCKLRVVLLIQTCTVEWCLEYAVMKEKHYLKGPVLP